jgi:selenocysteine lyase/cysteine desulfurase
VASLPRLRAQFPVLERVAYLNAGTCGPLPAAAAQAQADVAHAALRDGRATAYYERFANARERLRGSYAGLIGAQTADVAVTTATTEGMVRALDALGLKAGDEVLTAPDEHPGLLGPLAALRGAVGITIRTAPLRDIAAAITPRTRLVACSHVGWVSGVLAPAELAQAAGEIPLLLDGAQGAGAVPVDVRGLGCAFYAAAGQKWLCGPVGTGLLYVAPAWRERLTLTGTAYANLAEPGAGLEAEAHPDARALDAVSMSAEALTAAAAAFDVLAQAGWPAVHERAATLAEDLVQRLMAAGRTVAPRGRSTLVSWEAGDDAEAQRDRLAAAGVVVRNLPGTPYLRASVGAWNDESDLERLVAAV